MTRRLQCPRCMRPAPYCVCAQVQTIDHRTRVLVLQHPDEQKHPMNTARLAVLGLAHAECLTGLEFPDLAARLAAAHSPALLFPGPQACTPQHWASPHPGLPAPDLLIVPDGTWRQAGRLVRANPELEHLPRLMLADGATSRYRIRRAAQENAVSTIEAIVSTLSVLEPETDFAPVLRPFEAMVEGQIRAMGEAAYARHLALSAKRAAPDE